MEREKAKAIVTARRHLLAVNGQFWLRSERGKAWELWGEDIGLLRRLCRVPCSRVLWVIPF